MKKHSAVLIPGDGIGPEITAAVRRILDAAGAPLEWVERKAGVAALANGPDVLPDSTTEAIEHHGVALKGPCNPSRFDVLLLENLYGDVISDLCAGLVGGLGVVPGANFGDERAVFEAVHGSAPDIAGTGVANPLAMLMSAVMMLNHLADTREDERCRQVAERLKAAYDRTLDDDCKTPDLGGSLGTDAFADAVIERLAD